MSVEVQFYSGTGGYQDLALFHHAAGWLLAGGILWFGGGIDSRRPAHRSAAVLAFALSLFGWLLLFGLAVDARTWKDTTRLAATMVLILGTLLWMWRSSRNRRGWLCVGAGVLIAVGAWLQGWPLLVGGNVFLAVAVGGGLLCRRDMDRFGLAEGVAAAAALSAIIFASVLLYYEGGRPAASFLPGDYVPGAGAASLAGMLLGWAVWLLVVYCFFRRRPDDLMGTPWLWVYPALQLGLVIAGLTLALWLSREGERLATAFYLGLATTAADQMEAEILDRLSNTQADLALPEFDEVRRDLSAFQGSHDSVLYTYLWRLRNDRMEIFASVYGPGPHQWFKPGSYSRPVTSGDLRLDALGAAFRTSPLNDGHAVVVGFNAPVRYAHQPGHAAWFGFDIPASTWLAFAAKNRFSTYLGVLVSSLALAGLTIVEGRRRLLQSIRIRYDEEHRAALARERFLAFVSHELRTPIQVALGQWERFSSRATNPVLENNEWAVISEQLSALARLSEDLLHLSAGNDPDFHLRPASIDPRACCEGVLHGLAAIAVGRGLDFQTAGLNRLPARIFADGHRLAQIIRNVVHNAVFYTPAGSVRFGADFLPTGPESGDLVFVVEDTGDGIPPDLREAILNPYTRAPDATFLHGHGLGLAIVSRLLGKMGGRMEISNAPGRGSRFKLVIPVQALAVEAASTSDRLLAAAPQASRPLHILLAEDHKEIRDWLCAALRDHGHTVRPWLPGDALASGNPPEAAVIDWNLDIPGAATELLAHLKETYGAACRLLVITADPSPATRAEALAAGADGVLTKPFSLEYFHRWLGERPPPSARTAPSPVPWQTELADLLLRTDPTAPTASADAHRLHYLANTAAFSPHRRLLPLLIEAEQVLRQGDAAAWPKLRDHILGTLGASG